MNTLFDPNNRFWSTIGKITDVLLINLLTILCCLPVFTIGAAFTASYRVMMNVVRDAQSYTVKGFFAAFRDNFKKATGIWLIVLAAGAVNAADLWILHAMEGNAFLYVLRYLLIVTAILIIFIFLYVFPLTAVFENTVLNTIRNGFLMSLRHLPWTVLLVLIWAAPWLPLLLFANTILRVILPYMFFFGFGVCFLLSSLVFNHLFKAYMPREKTDSKKDEKLSLIHI